MNTNKEQASAYRIMCEMPTFKYLMMELEDIIQESISDEDRVSTENMTIQLIAECRGVRKGLNELLRRIQDNCQGG